MQIRDHAEAHPDKPAVIMHPSDTSVTFGELEARANRLAHFFRQAWSARGRRGRDPDGEQRALPRGDVGGSAQRSVLRPDQHPPDRRRGGVHHRQQQRQGHCRLGGTAKDPAKAWRAELPNGLPAAAAYRRR